MDVKPSQIPTKCIENTSLAEGTYRRKDFGLHPNS